MQSNNDKTDEQLIIELEWAIEHLKHRGILVSVTYEYMTPTGEIVKVEQLDAAANSV